MPSEEVEVKLDFPAPPEDVRAWWLSRAPGASAPDVEVVESAPGELHVVSSWPRAFGPPRRVTEVMRVGPDGSWSSQLRWRGQLIADHFTPERTEIGTRLVIRSVISPASWWGRLVGRRRRRRLREAVVAGWQHVPADFVRTHAALDQEAGSRTFEDPRRPT